MNLSVRARRLARRVGAVVAVVVGGVVAPNASQALPVDVADLPAAVPAAPNPPPTPYVAVAPSRMLDTRGGTRPAAGSVTDVVISGRGGVPAGAAAVYVSVTAVDAAGVGYLTVWPSGGTQPVASTLNVTAGATVANGTLVGLGSGGAISLFSSVGAHLLVDVQGYVPTGSSIRTTAPARLLDTRPGASTVDGLQLGAGMLGPRQTVEIEVSGRPGIPATGVGGVFLNLTAVDAAAAGFVTVSPAGSPAPTSSNLNVVAGQTVANAVFVGLGTGGRVALTVDAKSHLLVDVVGWAPTGSAPVAVTPARLHDSRRSAPTIDGLGAGGGPVRARASVDVQVTGRAGVPASGVGAVLVNVTAVGPPAEGFVTAWAAGFLRPEASILNYRAGQTVAVGTIVPVGDAGRISLYSQASTDLIVDVLGWLPGTTPTPPSMYGIDLAPFLGGPPAGPVTGDLVRELTERVAPSVGWIRTYECGGPFLRFPVEARRLGVKIAVGAWLSGDTVRDRAEVDCAVFQANAGNADMIVIGSETQRRKDLTEAELIAFLDLAQQRTTVPVTTAETDTMWKASPNLVASVDVVFANVYPFWAGVAIDKAGANLADSYAKLKAASAGKPVTISETGWPTCGSAVGEAVPSAGNASTYFAAATAWAKNANVPMFWMEAYDQAFKGRGPLGPVEACWGLWTAGGTRKYR